MPRRFQKTVKKSLKKTSTKTGLKSLRRRNPMYEKTKAEILKRHLNINEESNSSSDSVVFLKEIECDKPGSVENVKDEVKGEVSSGKESEGISCCLFSAIS